MQKQRRIEGKKMTYRQRKRDREIERQRRRDREKEKYRKRDRKKEKYRKIDRQRKIKRERERKGERKSEKVNKIEGEGKKQIVSRIEKMRERKRRMKWGHRQISINDNLYTSVICIHKMLKFCYHSFSSAVFLSNVSFVLISLYCA